MSEVITLVRGTVTAEGVARVTEAMRALVAEGLPPSIRETFVLHSDDGEVAIMTIWMSRADLDAMIRSGDEPLARRLIREAGGVPSLSILEVVLHGRHV